MTSVASSPPFCLQKKCSFCWRQNVRYGVNTWMFADTDISNHSSKVAQRSWRHMWRLTCYGKAPFVKLYSVIHKMCYNLHGSSLALDYTVVMRQKWISDHLYHIDDHMMQLFCADCTWKAQDKCLSHYTLFSHAVNTLKGHIRPPFLCHYVKKYGNIITRR